MTEIKKERKEKLSIEKILLKRAKEMIKDLPELIEIDSFMVGDEFGFGQLIGELEADIILEPEDKPILAFWPLLDDSQKRTVLNKVGKMLGVNLKDINEDQIVRHYSGEGIKGTPSESGANIQVLQTKLPELEVHIITYKNPELGTRYDLVRAR